MNHWWSGGTFNAYAATRVRYYVDESKPLELPLGLAHGMSNEAPQDDAPWSSGSLFGKTGGALSGAGGGSGFFNTFQIPFGKRVNVTIELADGCGSGCKSGRRGSEGSRANGGHQRFWLILRGRTNTAVALAIGDQPVLPSSARLRAYETKTQLLPPAAPLRLLASAAKNGAVLLVVLVVQSPLDHFQFLEGCMRAQDSNTSSANSQILLLSSGTEDYFLGTFYFDRGQYFLPLAGVTALCPPPPHLPSPSHSCQATTATQIRFSAYRVHGGLEPLVFEDGLVMSWRNGEPGHGSAPAPVNVSSLALVYEW